MTIHLQVKYSPVGTDTLVHFEIGLQMTKHAKVSLCFCSGCYRTQTYGLGAPGFLLWCFHILLVPRAVCHHQKARPTFLLEVSAH